MGESAPSRTPSAGRARLDRTLFTRELSPEDVAVLRLGFGFDGGLIEMAHRRADRGAVVTVLEVAIGTEFASFFKAFADEAGQQAFKAAISLLGARRERRAADTEVAGVLLTDTRRAALQVPLDSSSPDVAALGDIDWERVSDDWIVWDVSEGVWRGDASGILPRRRPRAGSHADVDERRPFA